MNVVDLLYSLSTLYGLFNTEIWSISKCFITVITIFSMFHCIFFNCYFLFSYVSTFRILSIFFFFFFFFWWVGIKVFLSKDIFGDTKFYQSNKQTQSLIHDATKSIKRGMGRWQASWPVLSSLNRTKLRKISCRTRKQNEKYLWWGGDSGDYIEIILSLSRHSSFYRETVWQTKHE